MKSLEITNLDQHLKPLKIDDKTTPLEVSETEFRVNEKTTIEKSLEVKGDLDIIGDSSSVVFNKNVSLEARSNEDYLTVHATNILLNTASNYPTTVASVFLSAANGIDSQITFSEAGGSSWSIGNDAGESTATLSFVTGAALGSSQAMSLDANGNTKQEGSISIKEKASAIADTDTYGQIWVKNTDPEELCFTDGGGTDIVGIGKYHFTLKVANFNTSATGNFVPLGGTLFESTSLPGKNESIAMVAPYTGTLERAVFRSEIAQDGNLIFAIHESADGTEVPALSAVGSKTTAIDIADDTSVVVDFDSMTSGTNVITKGRIYAIKLKAPTAPQDTNVTLVFKWDITS